MTKRRKNGRLARFGLALLGSCLVAASCGDEDATADTEPVFALERDVVADVEPLALIDPTAQIPAHDLRLLLQSLLAEHAMLSVETMRLAIDGEDDAATVDQLTENTDQLTGAIGLIYGRDGAFAFDQLWTNHIEFFNRYAAALRSGDEVEIESVKLELGHYESDFSSYIEAATAGELDVHTVEHVLHSHVSQLLDQADAWASGRFERAYAIGLEAHDHADVIAAALATGFASQNPDLFPGDVATLANDQCAAAQLRGTFALYATADAVTAERSGRPGQSAAAETAAAAARAAAIDIIATAEVLDEEIARFRSDVAAGGGGVNSDLPAARDTRVAELATRLVDDCS